jgi:predicted MFS family arabinose efflux permease
MIIGCALGALFGGKLVNYGRWKCLISSNLLVIVSSCAQLVYSNYPVFCIGKFFYGVAIGGFSVFSN